MVRVPRLRLLNRPENAWSSVHDYMGQVWANADLSE